MDKISRITSLKPSYIAEKLWDIYGINPGLDRALPNPSTIKLADRSETSQHFTTPGQRNKLITLFRECCLRGQLDNCKLLHDIEDFSNEEVNNNNDYAIPDVILSMVCENGHLEVAKWMTKTFNTVLDTFKSGTVLSIFMDKTLENKSKIDLYRWLFPTFNYTLKDLTWYISKKNGETLFSLASYKRNTELMDFLVNETNIDFSEYMKGDYTTAIYHDDMEIANAIYHRYRADKAGFLPKEVERSMKKVRESSEGRLNNTDWRSMDIFNNNPEETKGSIALAILRNKTLDTEDKISLYLWLFRTFKYTKEDLTYHITKTDDETLFSFASYTKNIKLMEFLVKGSGIDFSWHMSRDYTTAMVHNNTEIADMIRECYDFSTNRH